MMHDNKRSYIYWDGAEIAALAQLFADPSLNWIDPVQLATAKLDRPLHHCWVAPRLCQSSRQKTAQETLHKYLVSRGVELRSVDAPALHTECQQCGHTEHDHRVATSLALTLGLLSDAHRNRFDCAYIVANETARTLITQHQGLLPTDKQIMMLDVDAAALEAARLPNLVQCSDATKLKRPAIWDRPAWMLPTNDILLSENGV